jgi:hypothetical protein
MTRKDLLQDDVLDARVDGVDDGDRTSATRGGLEPDERIFLDGIFDGLGKLR